VYSLRVKIKGLISLPVIALVALFGVPISTLAQSILQSSDGFTLLGNTAITSTGPTVITGGNVGLSPTATSSITGFLVTDGGQAVITPPGGVIATGAVTQQAMTDLMTVASDLNRMTTKRNLTGLDLGGLVLTPGVYTFDGTAAQLADTTLTLDAKGQNDAYWVFNISTTLTTDANANVTVSNLGSNLGADDGIYWNVGAAVSIGADNLMAGNYLAGTSITIGSTTTGNSRVMAEVGAITLDSDNIISNGGPGGNSWDSGLMYHLGSISPIPEPGAFLWLVPLGALGLAFWHRRSLAKIGLRKASKSHRRKVYIYGA